ncbi:hypothetical protein BJP62_09620 [Jeongeupia sp. USM3]|nr:hypothetical protein BJP62_09620 [Jeongeupia sp. USM3]
MLEALIGILLMAAIGLGLTYAASRAAVAQRYTNTQNIVVSAIREQLVSMANLSAKCGNTIQVSVAANKNINFTVNCDPVSIAGKTIKVLSSIENVPDDDSRELLGGDGKIVISATE